MTEDEPIFSYSRAQAFADGVLVNLSDTKEWRETGFKVPVACTSAVWVAYIEWTAADTAEREVPQDQSGRLWDVLYMAARAARAARNRDRPEVLFDLYVVPRTGPNRGPKLTRLKMMIGPGDYLEPVITIMMPDED